MDILIVQPHVLHKLRSLPTVSLIQHLPIICPAALLLLLLVGFPLLILPAATIEPGGGMGDADASLPVRAGLLLCQGAAHDSNQGIIRLELVPGPNGPLLVLAPGIKLPKG